jgi:hypothetical protein
MHGLIVGRFGEPSGWHRQEFGGRLASHNGRKGAQRFKAWNLAFSMEGMLSASYF